MNLAWLAAVLSPQEIAPHPNLGSDAGLRPEVDLARIVTGKTPSWDSVERHIGFEKPGPDETIDEGVRGIYSALYKGLESAPSVSLLNELQQNPQENEDAARRTALTLVICFVAGGNDRYALCDSLIQNALNALDEADEDALLCRAALLQQRALRKLDAGEDAEDDSLAAASILERADVTKITPFPLNGATLLSPQDVADRIRMALTRATWSVVELDLADSQGRGVIPPRRQQLLSRRTDRYSQIKDHELYEYQRLVEEAFADTFRQQSQTRVGYDPPDLFFEMLAEELLGYSNPSGIRKQLAMMRLTRAYPSFSGTNVSDCLRLLRHAGSEDELRMVLGCLVENGPLEAIVEDARRILAWRNRYRAIRVVELVVLEAAADLMTTAEASETLDLIFSVLESGVPQNLPRRWQIDSKRFTTTCDAAVAVGGASGSIGRVAEYLLNSASVEKLSDELWDRAYARALRKIDWDGVPRAIQDGWAEFVSDGALRDSRTRHAYMQTILSSQPPEVPSEASLSAWVDALNWYLRRGDELPVALREAVAKLAVESVDRIRTEAGTGAYAHRGVDPAEVLAVLLIQHSDGALWRPLLDFFCDVRVAHSAKERALDVLSSKRVRMDELIHKTYQSGIQRLIGATDPLALLTPSRSEIFAACARFAAVYDFIDKGSQLNYVCTLASSRNRDDRRQAARTVRALADKPGPIWVSTLALQLSYDEDADVRVDAGRCLSRLLKTESATTAMISERLLQLLDSGGVSVPLAVLMDLRRDSDSPDSLRQKALTLRVGHISRRVRDAAARAMGSV